MFEKLTKHSMEIINREGEVLYCDTGKWLHPLFDCKPYLDNNIENISDVILHDKIQGQAAAALTIHLGFKHVFVDLISEKALLLYKRFPSIKVQYLETIDSIWCKTEALIKEEDTIDDIVTFLCNRAGKTI